MENPLVVNNKFSSLLAVLKECESAVLAFSGGVDSSFLLKSMKAAEMKILAVTAVSGTMPRRDRGLCESFAAELGIDHRIVGTDELSNESFLSNTPERCFFCKDGLFRKLNNLAAEGGFRYVFDGSNSDDLKDYRPGLRAAALHSVKSPLAELGFSKKEIRALSKEFGLKTWDRPSSPCLSSRFPYGRRITSEALRRVDDAEEFIRGLGVGEVRVRDDGDSARIEVNEEAMPLLLTPVNRRLVTDRLRSLGYTFVSVDLEGYRSGKMNRVLEDRNGAKNHN
jgi:uncharacterized protein